MRHNQNGLLKVLQGTIRKAPHLAALLFFTIIGAIIFALLPPLVLEGIINNLTAGQDILRSTVFTYFLMIVLAGLFDSAKELVITIFGQRVTHGLRSEMCKKLSRLPAGYFSTHDPGAVTSLFVNDVGTVESLFTNGIVSMFVDTCKVVSIIVVIFTKSLGLGFILLFITPLLFAFTRSIQKKMLRAQLQNRSAIARVNNHLPETIHNLRMIRSFSKQAYMEERYDSYICDSYTAVERSNLYDSIYSPIIIFAGSVTVAVVMCLSALNGTMQTFFGMSVGTAVAVIAYVGKVFEPLEAIGMEIQNVQSAVAGVRRINDFLSLENRPLQNTQLTEEILKANGTSVQFEQVCFAYEENQPILKKLSFLVSPGEQVTLIGRTGAGKSTAFKLLLGLYSPNSGKITVFGEDASAIPDEIKRRLFGYVEQSFQLLPGTIADQITMYDTSLSKEDCMDAARLVGLHETIQSFENGYDTPCQLSLFSKGQLQLLNIARAVVANPAILLLDEITANLDSATEERVFEALMRASKGRTVLSISHRLYEKSGGRQIPM